MLEQKKTWERSFLNFEQSLEFKVWGGGSSKICLSTKSNLKMQQIYNLATFLRAWQTQNVERLAAVTVADQRDTRERRSKNNTGLNTRQHRHINPGDGGFPGRRSGHNDIGSAAEQKRHNQSVLGFCRNGRAAELREERRQMMMFAQKYLNFLSEFRSQSLEECARRANKDRSSDKCLLYAAVRKTRTDFVQRPAALTRYFNRKDQKRSRVL